MGGFQSGAFQNSAFQNPPAQTGQADPVDDTTSRVIRSDGDAPRITSADVASPHITEAR